MTDRIPGTTYNNPIWYRGYRIYLSDGHLGQQQFTFCHDDFDGADDSNDNRCGDAESEQDAKNQIDDMEE